MYLKKTVLTLYSYVSTVRHKSKEQPSENSVQFVLVTKAVTAQVTRW